MAHYVSPKLYNKYKEQVLEMSPAIQHYEGMVAVREHHGLSDQEIADRLGLAAEDVTEIRCIAEIDLLPADSWLKAASWKCKRTRRAFKRRG